MSYNDYQLSIKLSVEDWSYYSVLLTLKDNILYYDIIENNWPEINEKTRVYDVIVARELCKKHYPPEALIMDLMRRADDENIQRLKRCFPTIYAEFVARYYAPGGILESDKLK